jgi:hypothetical protein
MRRGQFTWSRRALQVELQQDLQGLCCWRDVGRKASATLLVQLLALAATLRASLSAACRRCGCGLSPETIRQALLANLPGAAALLDPLRRRLQARLPRRLRRGKRLLAIDVHQRCYYGDVRHTPGVRGGHRRAGTKWFWAYATAALLEDGQRWTVGLTTVHKGQAMEVVVERLLRQVEPAELRVGRLLLDRGFYSAKVVALLQRRGIPFLMPVIRRGRGERGTRRFFDRSRRGWFRYTWESRDRKNGKPAGPTVTVRIACVPRPRGKRPLVYAFGGSFGSLADVRKAYRCFRETYRRRFGIETSYRQLGEALARTTSRSEAYRLLLVGIALLIRNLWVCCRQKLGPAFTLNWLLDECRAAYTEQLGRLSPWEAQAPVIPTAA